MKKKIGRVYFIGAGPGDPGLMTLRGHEILKGSDVIVVDALVHPSIFRSARQARVIYVGKRGPGAPAGSSQVMPQKKINHLLVRLAQQGLKVVRLKGGDPFLFGRGGEELETLKNKRISYQVIPGVSSALAAPAYAGIPLSDRRWASQVTFLTGQESATRGSAAKRSATKRSAANGSGVDWDHLSPQETLVIFMGVSRWPSISEKLLKRAFSPSTPVAAIEWGTTRDQKVIFSTLRNSRRDFQKNRLASPAIIVVGRVVSLGPKLSWIKRELPLLGRKIVLTRAVHQNEYLASLLRHRGADVLLCPAIQTQPLLGDPQLEDAVHALKTKAIRYDGVIFLSANGVRTFSSALGKNKDLLKNIPVIAVGPQTHRAAKIYGWKVRVGAAEYNGRAMLKNLSKIKGKRFLVPRGKGGPPDFIQGLKNKGAHVEVVHPYQTVVASTPPAHLKDEILNGVDAVLFTSGSTVKNFLTFFDKKERKRIFIKSTAVSIGPNTTQVLKSEQIHQIWEAPQATPESMVSVLIKKWVKK